MKRLLLVAVVCVVVVAPACAPKPQPKPAPVVVRLPAPVPFEVPAAPSAAYVPWGQHSVATRVAQIGPRARNRWRIHFQRSRVAYPPRSVVLVGLKREKVIHVYAGPSPYRLTMLRTIDVTAASGGPGPKFREGDKQVPEGVYRVDKLNPNSNFHVSLRLDYPNARDLEMAARDGRGRLGGNIMIHGGEQSIGCLAVGDEAAEDLFVLAADTGMERLSVLIAPHDLRGSGDIAALPRQPSWLPELYADLQLRLRALPPPLPGSSAPTLIADREGRQPPNASDYRAQSFARNAAELERRRRAQAGGDETSADALAQHAQPWAHESTPLTAQDLPWGSDPSAR